MGVLSGPGYCARNPRHSARRSKSSAAQSSAFNSHAASNDAAVAGLGSDNRFLAVQLNIPGQTGSANDV